MSRAESSTEWQESPERQVLPAGTRLWRVHSQDVGAGDFPPSGAATSHPAHLRVSYARHTAVAERFLTNLTFGADGTRTVQRPALTGQALSALITTADLIMAGLDAPHQLRTAYTEIPWAQGLLWRSVPDAPRWTAALFGGRCPAGALDAVPGTTIRLDDDAGASLLNEMLGPYHARAHPPDEQLIVFISYRHADEPIAARWLDEELRKRLGDAAVFLDASMPPGTEFPGELINNVRRSKVLLAVIGPQWEASYDREGQRLLDRDDDWVRVEIAEALAHSIHVIPILVGARERLNPGALPENIREIATRHHIHLADGYRQKNVADLVDELIPQVPALASAYAARINER